MKRTEPWFRTYYVLPLFFFSCMGIVPLAAQHTITPEACCQQVWKTYPPASQARPWEIRIMNPSNQKPLI